MKVEQPSGAWPRQEKGAKKVAVGVAKTKSKSGKVVNMIPIAAPFTASIKGLGKSEGFDNPMQELATKFCHFLLGLKLIRGQGFEEISQVIPT